MKKILMKLIRFYQKYISPATQPSCRYHPTCSNYALEAIDKHGALKGGIMGSARILRCNPFVEGGVDRVPDYFTLRRNPANVGEVYIPGHFFAVDSQTKADIEHLLASYRDDLVVGNTLPDALVIMEQLVQLEELSSDDFKKEFSIEELNYLTEIQILPSLTNSEYRYFTLSNHPQNKKYLKQIQPFAEGIELGVDHPLIVMEKTGIWYTNLPTLQTDFLITRGVTEADLENDSYHLWLVLQALAQKEYE